MSDMAADRKEYFDRCVQALIKDGHSENDASIIADLAAKLNEDMAAMILRLMQITPRDAATYHTMAGAISAICIDNAIRTMIMATIQLALSAEIESPKVIAEAIATFPNDLKQRIDSTFKIEMKALPEHIDMMKEGMVEE